MQINPNFRLNFADIAVATDVLTYQCHQNAANWWIDAKTGADIRDNPLTFGNKLLLVHSEISEACEGDRKSRMDDHLPQYEQRAVELADALIRIHDLAGGFDIPLGEIVAAKLAYNAQRADHKLENRAAEGGKAY